MDNISRLEELDVLLCNPGNPVDEPGGWNEWRRFVLAELKRLAASEEKIERTVNALKANQTKLLVKVGLIVGGISMVMGLVGTAIIVSLLELVIK